MSESTLEQLLERLCSGDAAAAEQVFRAYEPYLRVVVRRLLPDPLRPKFDSSDVVQSVFADLLRGFRESGWRFENANQLRAFLVKVTRNRFLDRLRQYQTAMHHEYAAASTVPGYAQDPAPSAVAEASELWQRILTLCPPQHRELVRMKRDGCALAEIAAHTGLHESSIRRILYDLARAVGRPRSL